VLFVGLFTCLKNTYFYVKIVCDSEWRVWIIGLVYSRCIVTNAVTQRSSLILCTYHLLCWDIYNFVPCK